MREKNSADGKTIILSVEHKMCTILVRMILYAQVKDKLCTIYLTSGEPVKVFLSISALKDMLPADEFVTADRSFLVALRAIRNISDGKIYLSDSRTIPVSRRRMNMVVQSFQSYLTRDSHRQTAALRSLDLPGEFACMNSCPWPFFIVEAAPDTIHTLRQLRFRCANDAFASLVQTALPRLMRLSFADIFPGSSMEPFLLLAQIALSGGMGTCRAPLAAEQIFLLNCWQPHYGFCACLMLSPEHLFERDSADAKETV